jgi:uncharacterized protein
MAFGPEAFFLPSESVNGGQRFCLFHAAKGTRPLGLVLYVHPFAEEMNKSRRMAALQCRAFAEAGYAVLQIDLLGCGDSSGDFGDASWQAWVDDVVQGCQWLQAKARSQDSGAAPMPIWFWGLRAGCLLAVEAAVQIGSPVNFLFWQPPSSGKPLFQQFLRLKVVGDLIGGQGKGVMEMLRQQLGDGTAVEIAGYMLSPALASGMERSALSWPQLNSATAPTFTSARVEWLELSTREDAALSPASVKTVEQWANAGFSVHSQVVTGPAFWQTSEIEEAPALLAASVAALRERATA